MPLRHQRSTGCCAGAVNGTRSAAPATITEALKCKESGEAKTILFNLSGHGFVDMASYDKYFSGEMQNYHVSEEDLAAFIQSADALNANGK